MESTLHVHALTPPGGSFSVVSEYTSCSVSHFTDFPKHLPCTKPLRGHRVSVGRKGYARKQKDYLYFMLFLHHLYKCRGKHIPTRAGWVPVRLTFRPLSRKAEGMQQMLPQPCSQEAPSPPSQSLMCSDPRSPLSTQRCNQLLSHWHPHNAPVFLSPLSYICQFKNV